MTKKKIEKDYKEKIKRLVKLNHFYYEKSNPIVEDSEYDRLKQEILKLERQYDYLKNKSSPSVSVGFRPSKNFTKVAHKVPMLSLANAFDQDDLVNFEKKIMNFINQKEVVEIEYSAEPKIDGISASLIYKDGQFVTGLSRGDGKEGEDITENLKTIRDIPHKIALKDFPEEIDVRGEIFIQNDDFKKISNKFANPRNAASGSLRQKNPEETKKIPLKFIAYTYGYEKGMKISKQNEFLKRLKEWGFKVNPLNKTIKGIKNLMKNYYEIDFDIEEVGTPVKFNWGKCPLATASFGHGITTTLLQIVKAYSIIVNGGYYINPTLIKNSKITRPEKVLDENISSKILPILRKIVSTKEGTANLADIDGYEIGGKTGTANKSFKGMYSKEKINTFVSVFPTTKPKFILAVMLDAPKINDEYIYNYRDGSNFKLKGSPRNTAGWNSVEVAGHIIEKIGPILATKYSEVK